MNLLKYLISKKYREVYRNKYTRKMIEIYNNEMFTIEDIYRVKKDDFYYFSRSHLFLYNAKIILHLMDSDM